MIMSWISRYGALVATLAFGAGAGTQSAADGQARAAKSDAGFSFVAYGDSRSMMYLPYTVLTAT
jgi:hypothetical protein